MRVWRRLGQHCVWGSIMSSRPYLPGFGLRVPLEGLFVQYNSPVNSMAKDHSFSAQCIDIELLIQDVGDSAIT
jgi:hypothetical protein